MWILAYGAKTDGTKNSNAALLMILSSFYNSVYTFYWDYFFCVCNFFVVVVLKGFAEIMHSRHTHTRI